MKFAFIILTMLFVSLSVSCGAPGGQYASCDLATNSTNETEKQCATNTSGSCVVTNNQACDSKICGRFEGSDPFCTDQCEDDGECNGGVCREFVFQSGEKYCVDG